LLQNKIQQNLVDYESMGNICFKIKFYKTTFVIRVNTPYNLMWHGLNTQMLND